MLRGERSPQTRAMHDRNAAHATLIAAVSSLTAFDETEAAHLIDILAWLNATTDVYRRAKPATPDRHLAVYCVPVDLAGRRVFLGHHRSAQRWLPPGGHVDLHESPRSTAVRECEEELGVTPRLFGDAPLLASVETTTGADVHTDVTLWFAFDAAAHAPMSLAADEFDAQRWVAFDDVHSLDTNPNLARFLAKLSQLQA
jgi:8-oxo-dGTP pyrophosphatase MutT (NUDIX family)